MLGALSAIGSIFSFFGKLISALGSVLVYRAGEKEQRLKDDEATISEADKAQKIDASIDRDGHDALVDGLRKYARKP